MSEWTPVICPSCHQEAFQFPPAAQGSCIRCFKKKEAVDEQEVEGQAQLDGLKADIRRSKARAKRLRNG